MNKKIAIAGLGNISKFYIPAIANCARAELACVCDIDEGKLSYFKERGVPVFGSIDELLDCGSFDAIVITTPNDTHYPLIDKCLKKGKHVLCEKPLGLNMRETKELIDKARRNGILLMTAFHRRYNKNLSKLLSENRKYIAVYARYLEDITVHSGDENWYFDPRRSGGGCVIDNGINVFDSLRQIFGDLRVVTSWVNYSKKGDQVYDSSASVILVHKRGSIFVELDWHHKEEIKDFIAVDEAGNMERIDLLAGSKGFKGSLWHEYEGVAADFIDKLDNPGAYTDTDSLKAMRLVEEAYKKGS